MQSLETAACCRCIWELEPGWSERCEKDGKKWGGRDSPGQDHWGYIEELFQLL